MILKAHKSDLYPRAWLVQEQDAPPPLAPNLNSYRLLEL